MLELIKTALRVTTDAFDDEIQVYIDDCIKSMNKLGVVAATADTNDPQIMTAVMAYCKWKFGHSDEKDAWQHIYEEKLAELKMQSGYTDWGTSGEA